MLYTIYKVVNVVNDKFYIGKHQTKDLNDGYMGSGKAIRAAIKQYGIESFTKEILFVFDNEAEMNAKEKELVTENLVNDSKSYNLGIGGEGGAHFKGRQHTADTKNKIKNSMIGKKYNKTSDQLKRENESRRIKNNGKFFSDSTILNIIKAKGSPVVINGVQYYSQSQAKRETGFSFSKIKKLAV